MNMQRISLHKLLLIVVIASCLLVLIRVHGNVRAADPAGGRPAVVPAQVRANLAFNAQQYDRALPLLQALLSEQTDPARRASIEEQIRVCQRNLSTAAPPVDSTAAENSDLLVGNAPSNNDPVTDSKHRVPHPVPKAGEVLALDIKELGNFEYDPAHPAALPDDVKRLNGVKLRTHGFMVSMGQAEDVTEFALVPSLFQCCGFGSAPQIQHTIFVHCPKGKAISYYADEVSVEGTLSVQEKKDDGFVISLFELETSSVKPTIK